MSTLQLLICTYNDGINRIPDLLLPPMHGVSYLVSWQRDSGFTPPPLPEGVAGRGDVEVHTLEGRGLSRNRNNCLLHATGDICLICDDDCRYTSEALHAVADTFDVNPEVDLISFVAKNSAGSKRYPTCRFNLRKKVHNFYVSSIEMAFRRTSVVGRVAFNERFGLGSDLFGAGEEAIFISDAIAAGLNCQYFPIQIVEHLGPTTSATRFAQEEVLRSNGAVLYRNFRSTMWLRLPLLAWRVSRRSVLTFSEVFRHLRDGIREMRRLSSAH